MTTVRSHFIKLAIALPLITLVVAILWPPALWLFVLWVPLLALGTFDLTQKRRSILRLYPVLGHFRYLLESVRPEIQQYFVETNLNGRPISREFRDLAYQRAKGVRDTRPFGTQFDVYESGHEWLSHSLAPSTLSDAPMRVRFGGKDCQQPYDASPINISAMSFGALSQPAITALNTGAKRGGFAHNTGEGGISPYHRGPGGDLIWQLGTGYFGCRDDEGQFDPDMFAEKAHQPQVKMIEIKLSQGAKPGHGGLLPGAKVTPEIAEIRHVPEGKSVHSPAYHSAFDSPIGLLQFVAQLRTLSGGKPVGFKLCIGRRSEFLAITKAMLETGIYPDFITIDGSEGGTGAAPIELTNSVGMPLREALAFVHSALIGAGLRHEVRLIASGKAMSAFHVFRLMALGADAVNMARAMMFALGCIQSRACNTDLCPTGIATQNPERYLALDVEDKAERVFKYHHSMIEALRDLLSVVGATQLHEIQPDMVNRRVSSAEVRHYGELFPNLAPGALLREQDMNETWQQDWRSANAAHW